MQRTVLIHHHIFKNAGTSFNHALERAFGERFLEFDLSGSQVVTQAHLASFLDEKTEVLAVSGHHICLPTPQSEAVQTLSSVLLRKPLSRIRSIYEFERKQNAQTEGAVMAKQLDFKDFVVWRLETSPHVFCNYQTLYCARTDNLYAKYAPTQADLALALENLKTCLVIGTVERYSEFLLMAQYELNRYHPDIVLRNLHLNITAKPATEKRASTREMLIEELGQEIVEKLEEMNQFDEQLYQFADGQLSDWLAQEVEAKASYFEATGTRLLENRRWQDAKAAFQGAIAIKPSWFKPHYGLGAITDRLGDVDGAIRHYRRAAELNPGFAWTYLELGNLFYRQEAFGEAADYYRHAIAAHLPNENGLFHLKLGDALLEDNEVEAAIASYQQAERLNPNSMEAKLKLSLAYLKNQDWQPAEDFALKALQLAPDSCAVYVRLGDICWAKGEKAEAVDYYRKGTAIEPENMTCAERLKRVVAD